MLQVLGRIGSINVRKVLWTCREMGLAYELQQWGTPDRPVDEPAFRSLNPNGLVPVIRDGEFVLWESNAICRYLAAQHGRTDLLPMNPRERAHVEQWMDWQATELNNSWRYAFMALVRHSPSHTDRASIDASLASWNRHMTVLEGQLQRTGSFVAGFGFTLADIVLALSINRWLMTPMVRDSLPAVAAYFDRLGGRPGFVEHCRNGMP